MNCTDTQSLRQAWLAQLLRIACPVLEAGAAVTLKARMPVRALDPEERRPYAHLEACARTLAGLAPWLELTGLTGTEAARQARARSQAQALLASITHPGSPDFLNFRTGRQPLVDAAILAQAILRAPRVLWQEMPGDVRQNILHALADVRTIKPYLNNWLLFLALIEAFFVWAGKSANSPTISHVIKQLGKWYVGDGSYADGPIFHCDYYNSFVIHPFLLDICAAVDTKLIPSETRQALLLRTQRYVELLERMVSPEGVMPATGRSLTYRCGTLHAAAQLALMHALPDKLPPAQLRTAMDAVIQRQMNYPETFDAQGWLNIGCYGHQPALAENYISTGSLYMCTLAFMPLGLAPEDEFWGAPAMAFTSQKLVTGADLSPDIAQDKRERNDCNLDAKTKPRPSLIDRWLQKPVG